MYGCKGRNEKLKKILAFVLLSALVLSLFACDLPTVDTDGLNIISTVFVGYDLARQISGGNANITLLLPPGTESHAYEPTPRDMINISKCDLFIYVGGESESWVEKLIGDDIMPKKVIKMMDLVEVLTEEDDDDHGHSHEEGKIAYDEHVWTSPKNTILILDAVATAFSELDGDHIDVYEQNAKAYRDDIEQLDGEFREYFARFETPTLVFGDRFPLRYFADEYGIDYYSAFAGCSGESEPSAQVMAMLIDKVKSENIPAVFYIELSNHKVADSIAEATGAKSVLFNTCHNVTSAQFEEGVTYLSLMKDNLALLKEVLG